MKHLTIASLLFCLFACKKEDKPQQEVAATKKDYSAFLAQTNHSFEAFLDKTNFGDTYFNWRYGWQFQGFFGYQNASGICDTTDPVRISFCGLRSQYDNGADQFFLYSPAYNINTASSSEIADLFSPGIKKLGQTGDCFSLGIYRYQQHYNSFNSATQGQIEILKSEAYVDGLGKKAIRVWCLLDAKLSTNGSEKQLAYLHDGLMIASFYYTDKNK